MGVDNPRQFSYYLFENFDGKIESGNPWNPRSFITPAMDPLISVIADAPPGSISLAAMCEEFGALKVNQLLTGGVLRREGDRLLFDTPIFLSEDVATVQTHFANAASGFAVKIATKKQELCSLAATLENGFSAPVNLYHILCGMCLDGLFLDKLGETGILANGRMHATGLDYLSVIYEKCSALDSLSDGLLCSYNRITDGVCALQSFGDSNGNRLDCYRYFRLREREKLTDVYKRIHAVTAAFTEADLLNAVKCLLTGTTADARIATSLEVFGYLKDGQICVPVYREEHRKTIREIENLLEELLLHPVVQVLSNIGTLPITATAHGVSTKEIANECWHILFGSINEALVQMGLVAAPPYREGEGRYLQSIEFYG